LPPGEAAAIAVSGGADSFALLSHAVREGHPVVALTVDHGLREGSAAEAQAVRTWCSERNIPHETLIWRGEKPSSGIQAAAREARYRLLCQACERMGIGHLITAHTADDQAETVFMRLRRGAGRGLAGIPASRKIAAGPGEPITLWRPMLGIRRDEVRGYAKEQALPFVDDPSNEDDRFERVRVRALLGALEEQDLLTVEALCRTARDVESLQTELCLAHYWDDSEYEYEFAPDGSLSAWDNQWIDGYDLHSPHFQAEWHHAREFLRKATMTISGDGPINAEKIPLPVPERKEAAFGVVYHWSVGQLHLLREPAALLGRADGTPGFTPLPAAPGSKHLYDRRFIVSVPEDAPEGLHLRPLGQLLPKDIATSTLARQRISTLPCLARGATPTHLPEQAVDAVTNALKGWKGCDSFLSAISSTFPARSLLAERFAGDVIRY
jgi:tRNA(Ile)-lysidine synthase